MVESSETHGSTFTTLSSRKERVETTTRGESSVFDRFRGGSRDSSSESESRSRSGQLRTFFLNCNERIVKIALKIYINADVNAENVDDMSSDGEAQQSFFGREHSNTELASSTDANDRQIEHNRHNSIQSSGSVLKGNIVLYCTSTWFYSSTVCSLQCFFVFKLRSSKILQVTHLSHSVMVWTCVRFYRIRIWMISRP